MDISRKPQEINNEDQAVQGLYPMLDFCEKFELSHQMLSCQSQNVPAVFYPAGTQSFATMKMAYLNNYAWDKKEAFQGGGELWIDSINSAHDLKKALQIKKIYDAKSTEGKNVVHKKIAEWRSMLDAEDRTNAGSYSPEQLLDKLHDFITGESMLRQKKGQTVTFAEMPSITHRFANIA